MNPRRDGGAVGTVAGRRRVVAGFGPDQVRPLLVRSNRPGARRLGIHLALLAAGAAAVAAARGTWWLAPAWALDGVVIAHLFALQHETAHGTAFSGRTLNRALTTVCGAVLGIAPAYFRFEHIAHHNFTQDPDRDPEMIQVPASLGRWLWFVVGGPFWAYQAATLGRHAVGRFRPDEVAFLPARARAQVQREAWWLIAGWAALLAVPPALGAGRAVLVFWVVPRVLGEPVMRVARLSEHAGRPITNDVAVNTRTLDVIAPLRFLAWNMPYHAEHHALPAVPYHALPRARTLFAGHLDGPHGGYLAAQAEIFRQMRARRAAG